MAANPSLLMSFAPPQKKPRLLISADSSSATLPRTLDLGPPSPNRCVVFMQAAAASGVSTLMSLPTLTSTGDITIINDYVGYNTAGDDWQAVLYRIYHVPNGVVTITSMTRTSYNRGQWYTVWEIPNMPNQTTIAESAGNSSSGFSIATDPVNGIVMHVASRNLGSYSSALWTPYFEAVVMGGRMFGIDTNPDPTTMSYPGDGSGMRCTISLGV